MHALTYHGIKVINHEKVDDPVILDPGDVIVKVNLAGICGSDLHVYNGRESGLDEGTVMGHEFTGEIVETGSSVKRMKIGQRVLSPFTTSCGHCYYCTIGLTCRCEKGNLYGWVENGRGLHGGQAEYVRVPMAETTLVSMSNDISDEQGLLLGDILSTGFFCADMASINEKGVFVTIGCGPVGLMTILSAKFLGAANLFAVDTIPSRLQKAASLGANTINAKEQDVEKIIRAASQGRGADAIMEAVGSPSSVRLAYQLVRPGGIISSVGVHTSQQFSFSPVEAYNKNITFRTGRCPARYYAEKLLREQIIQRYQPESIITHRFKLEQGADAYRIFDQKEDNCIKPILQL